MDTISVLNDMKDVRDGLGYCAIDECHVVVTNKMPILYVYSDEVQGQSNGFIDFSLEYLAI